MGLESALLPAIVAHARLKPKRNAFHYGVYYLCIDLDDLSNLSDLLLVSYNKFNFFSFYKRDHGPKNGDDLQIWLRSVLKEWQIYQANGRIILLTMPRLFGHVFNPVSFWFCLDQQENLRAVLAEVNNTFGESHSYLIHHEDNRPILAQDKITAKKIFHVSPFIDIEGHYSFRFHYSEEKIGVWIDHIDESGKLLTTSLVGQRQALNSPALLKYFFRYPLVTLKVIGLIHFQAIKLLFKGIKYRPRPLPPEQSISR